MPVTALAFIDSITADQIAALRPYGLALRHTLTTECIESSEPDGLLIIPARSVIATVNGKGEPQLSIGAECNVAVIDSSDRSLIGEVFTCKTRRVAGALGQL